jgi:hypothetical protein
MKKMIITAFILIATTGVLSAQKTNPGNTTPGTNKNNPGYVDANKNSICDNYEKNTGSFAGKGQGQCNGRGGGYGKGNGNGQCCPGSKGCRPGNAKGR